ncbi:hypothetical protein C7212DRAFT_365164 [Tuber magnatum]|uniref:Uncharacterized protein n=1 Tax=Tuber magnatum TaxID=42249 RepID=A0A317SJM3_9PEZI|nr:hypothetical protein C7212DRAFT_365164 [Tuber magnatum]
MSDEIRNVVVFPTTFPVALPPHPDNLAVPLSGEDYQAAKNLRALYQLIYQICPGGHGHYASFPNATDSLPRNYSAKVRCTGDGTAWRVVMGPQGVKGMVWYFCGLKKVDGMFNTAVIRYWTAEQCEAFVEALESGGMESLPHDWRFVVRHNEVVNNSENLPTNSTTQAAVPQDTTGTNGVNGYNVSQAEDEVSVGGL